MKSLEALRRVWGLTVCGGRGGGGAGLNLAYLAAAADSCLRLREVCRHQGDRGKILVPERPFTLRGLGFRGVRGFRG